MGYEVNRQEQVAMIQKTIHNHWECTNPTCNHKWFSEEFVEYEGSLDK